MMPIAVVVSVMTVVPMVAITMVISIVTVVGMRLIATRTVAVSVVTTPWHSLARVHQLAAIRRAPIAGIPVLAHLVPGTEAPAVRPDSDTVAVTASTLLRGSEGWNNQGENQSKKKGRYSFHCHHLKRD